MYFFFVFLVVVVVVVVGSDSIPFFFVLAFTFNSFQAFLCCYRSECPDLTVVVVAINSVDTCRFIVPSLIRMPFLLFVVFFHIIFVNGLINY